MILQIEKNRPELQDWYVSKLATTFDETAKKYNIDSHLLTAIAMQESGYTLDAKQCYKIHGKVHCDFCMMQINDKTIKNFGFDQKTLMENEVSCIGAGAKVLSEIKGRYSKREKDYWTRYNASSREKRAVYKSLVERYL